MKEQIKKLEQKFIKLYKKAINQKSQQKDADFFNTDQEMALIAAKICALSGTDEIEIRQLLLEKAREDINY